MSGKLKILYEVGCLAQSYPEISELFAYLFKDFEGDSDSLHCVENFTKLGRHSFLPLEKELESVILVLLEAHNQHLIDLKKDSQFSNFLKGVTHLQQTALNLNPEFQDTRDPFSTVAKKAFSFLQPLENSELKSNTQLLTIGLIPTSLAPEYHIINNHGNVLMAYVTSPEDTGFRKISRKNLVDVVSSPGPKHKILGKFFGEILQTHTTVICLPYEFAFEISGDGGHKRFFESAENLSLKKKLNLDLKQLEELLLNTNFQDSSGTSQGSSEGTIDRAIGVLKGLLDSKSGLGQKKLLTLAEDFLTLAYAYKIGFSNNGTKKQGISVSQTGHAMKQLTTKLLSEIKGEKDSALNEYVQKYGMAKIISNVIEHLNQNEVASDSKPIFAGKRQGLELVSKD